MEIHHSFLQFALEQADNELNATTLNPTSSVDLQNSIESSSVPKSFSSQNNPTVLNNNIYKTTRTNIEPPQINTSLQIKKLTKDTEKTISTCNGLLRHTDKKSIEEAKDLLNGDEAAPADPSSS